MPPVIAGMNLLYDLLKNINNLAFLNQIKFFVFPTADLYRVIKNKENGK
ncbi:hypothetical protein GJU39_04340 [Pedobacter petrophilus]|uniref:Uncharacterized protein n=1 Tax=Pedobacter petrophilus TaxID=1908241 RepID=A0A7K0FVQ4_9SPHI|nr:hypothetical protein [Pedobacter petrophilus]MRX75310.1 hypothetical protein [Pedobacter petrophilus]